MEVTMQWTMHQSTKHFSTQKGQAASFLAVASHTGVDPFEDTLLLMAVHEVVLLLNKPEEVLDYSVHDAII